MTFFHLVLGIAVVVLCTVAGVLGALGKPVPPAIAAWALGTLAVQVASGMFLLTATSEGPGAVHILLPLAGLAVVFAARASRGRARTAGWAYLFAAAASVVAFVTGLQAG